MNFVCMGCGAITSTSSKHTDKDCEEWVERLIHEEITRNKKSLRGNKLNISEIIKKQKTEMVEVKKK